MKNKNNDRNNNKNSIKKLAGCTLVVLYLLTLFARQQSYAGIQVLPEAEGNDIVIRCKQDSEESSCFFKQLGLYKMISCKFDEKHITTSPKSVGVDRVLVRERIYKSPNCKLPTNKFAQADKIDGSKTNSSLCESGYTPRWLNGMGSEIVCLKVQKTEAGKAAHDQSKVKGAK